LSGFRDLTRGESDYIRMKFESDIRPLLFPTILGKKQPFPFLKNKEVYGFAVLETKSGKRRFAIVPSLSPMFPRSIVLTGMSGSGGVTVVPVDEVILHYFADIFHGYKVVEKSLIRIIRNTDLDEERVYDEELDYRSHIAEVIKMRKKLSPVKLELSRELSEAVVEELCSLLKLSRDWVFRTKAPISDDYIKPIKEALADRSELFYKPRTPQRSPSLSETNIIPQVLKKDVLLHYPYESITPFLNLLQQAAQDKNVISIQMTLYRLAPHSKVIQALTDAAENGKEVDVLVELKARFDEENNINWSKQLEQAGCRVVYGIDGLKVHSKICLITRRNGKSVQYITQIGTGNYNESTAKLYTDLSLITANREIGIETSNVIRKIMMGETVGESQNLFVAPHCLQNRIIDCIDDEIKKAKKGEPAYIGVKLNSMTDVKIMERLITASQVGVKIDMVIRGICCLKPGIKGYTDNIRIVSIVGRLLEHSRIYIFGSAEKPEERRIYISSADFMTRNTLKRVEVAVPIFDEDIKTRISGIFDDLLKDTAQARLMQSDGTYKRLRTGKDDMCVQEYFYDKAESRNAQ
ncbi:MAG: polyphosphate kinase 1, partial [Ruminococcus sp.]|nr:polyphosphate kinase 1 [Ruminococcus sp.]